MKIDETECDGRCREVKRLEAQLAQATQELQDEQDKHVGARLFNDSLQKQLHEAQQREDRWITEKAAQEDGCRSLNMTNGKAPSNQRSEP